jgi:hypothetical protein
MSKPKFQCYINLGHYTIKGEEKLGLILTYILLTKKTTKKRSIATTTQSSTQISNPPLNYTSLTIIIIHPP